MILNKDYRKVLKRGHWVYNFDRKEMIRKQNYSGIVLAACLLLSFVLVVVVGVAGH